jgi:hypothetical protein
MSADNRPLSDHYRESAQKARHALEQALADLERERQAFQLELLREKELERRARAELYADPWANGVPPREDL